MKISFKIDPEFNKCSFCKNGAVIHLQGDYDCDNCGNCLSICEECLVKLNLENVELEE